MSRAHFQEGLNLYRAGNYQEALQQFDEALKRCTQNSYLVLDSRAAVYLKLGNIKEAMKDAKKTIDVAPDRWQGYARAARLFLKTQKFDASLTMIKMAIDRLKVGETERRVSLLSLEVEVQDAQRQLDRHRQRFTDHMGKLPVELFGEIARILMQQNHTASITLSQVSKHWRSVAHNLPYLWNVLVVTRRRPRQKATTWIKRSNGRIRELSIRDSALDVPHWSGDSLDLLQWECVRVLRVQKWDVAAFLRSIGQLHSLLNLQHLEVESPGGAKFLFGETSLLRFLPEGPQPLRHLSLTLTNLSEKMPIQARNLTSLALDEVNVSGANLADLLEANQSLESLTLKGISCDNHIHSKFSLPHLAALETKGFQPGFIYTLELPNLQILRVESPTISQDLNSFLRHLIATGTSRLTELGLRSCRCDAGPIIDLLHISSGLKHLEVSNNANCATPIIEALAGPSLPHSNRLPPPTPDSLVLCPNLTHVNFSRCPDVQTGPLVRMIKSRLPPPDIRKNEISGHSHMELYRLPLQPSSPPQASIALSDRSQRTTIVSLVIDECPNVDSTWLAWFREKVGSVSCVYMKKTAKFRGPT